MHEAEQLSPDDGFDDKLKYQDIRKPMYWDDKKPDPID